MDDQGVPIAVLAGGASRRMGRDKRSVHVYGEPMLDRVVRTLPVATEILVVIDPARPLPVDVLTDARVRIVHDLRPGQGPLAAMEAGLSATQHDVLVVIACDMPWVEPAILHLLVARLESSPGADLACLATRHGRQLPVACRRSPTLAAVTAMLDRGERRLRAILDGPRVVAIDERSWRAIDPSGRSVMDVDTPADLARVG